MIPIDQAVVARLDSHGERFELLVDPDLAVRIREGRDVPLEDAVAALQIFGNSAHGTRASDEALQKVFHTTDFAEVATRIIAKGEIHLTTEQRRQLIAEKRRQVIAHIARNAINPQTNLPHPPQRIEMAMEEARVNIDPFKKIDELVKETVKALRPLLPIRFEEVRIAVKIPPEFAPRAFGEIRAGAVVEKDEWQKDGSWICVVRVPAGVQGEFYDEVNRLTKGQGETRILN
ncbi:MAG: ribosome assembly factor SBDS [Methanomicrobiales archaeon]|jgi:ribosome maturation protein SDO1|nr:ribosome assembly factor SBDS [Methanomicrobiales archaeon]